MHLAHIKSNLRQSRFRHAARIEFAGVFFLVDLLDNAVNPAKTQGPSTELP